MYGATNPKVCSFLNFKQVEKTLTYHTNTIYSNYSQCYYFVNNIDPKCCRFNAMLNTLCINTASAYLGVLRNSRNFLSLSVIF